MDGTKLFLSVVGLITLVAGGFLAGDAIFFTPGEQLAQSFIGGLGIGFGGIILFFTWAE